MDAIKNLSKIEMGPVPAIITPEYTNLVLIMVIGPNVGIVVRENGILLDVQWVNIKVSY
jgi:hypothetical protein